MSDEMYRQRIRSLEERTDKLVERNDQLRKEIEWVGDLNRALVDGHEKAVREVVRICYALGDGENLPEGAGDAVDWVVALKAERKALAAQVESLQAWKDAVPVDALMSIADFCQSISKCAAEVGMIAKWMMKMPQ